MNHNKISTLILAMTTLALLCSAQDEHQALFAQPQTDIETNAAFASVGARFREIRVLRADFSQQKKIAALRRPLRSSGRFLFAPEHGVWWHTTAPFQTTFVMTPHGIMEQSGDSEPFKIAADEQPIVMGFSKVFMSLFNGDTEEMQARFEVYFQGSKDNWRLGLKPRSKIMARLIERIVLSGKDHIEVIHFRERSGDLTVINFTEVTTQEPPLTSEEIGRFAF